MVNPNISSIAPMQDFVNHAKDGLITLQSHPDNSDLVVANYTPYMAYNGTWDAVNLNSRGLIFNKVTGEIVARAFSKFFNYSQDETAHIDTNAPLEVANKEDGSMGVLYRDPSGEWAISTRGSMTSTQALHATEVFRAKYPHHAHDEDYTLIFEIIFPEGRIVVHYGDMDDLILIGAVHKETGRSMSRAELLNVSWDGPVAESFSFANMREVFEAPQMSNREGFVVHFPEQDQRVKVKFEEYLAIHRSRFKLTPRSIHEMMAEEADLDEFMASLPDEFSDDAKKYRDAFLDHTRSIITTARGLYYSLYVETGDVRADRKAFAKVLPGAVAGMKDEKLVKNVSFLLAQDPERDDLDQRVHLMIRP